MLRSQIHSPGIVSIELKKLTDENSELKLKLLHYQDLDQQHHELTEKYNELKVKYDTVYDDPIKSPSRQLRILSNYKPITMIWMSIPKS